MMPSSVAKQSTHEADGIVHTVGNHDVVFGRGGFSYCHAGNRLFRRLVQHNRELYQASTKLNHRSSLAFSIVSAIHSTGGRFLRKQEGTSCWKSVNMKDACIKTSQALRDANVRTRKCSSGSSTTKSSSSHKSDCSVPTSDHVEPKKGSNPLTPVVHNPSSPQLERIEIFETTALPIPAEISSESLNLSASEIETIERFASCYGSKALEGHCLRQSFLWLSEEPESSLRRSITWLSSELRDGSNPRLSIKWTPSNLLPSSYEGMDAIRDHPLEVTSCQQTYQEQQQPQRHYQAHQMSPNPKMQARFSTSSATLVQALLVDEDWIDDWGATEENIETNLGVDCY